MAGMPSVVPVVKVDGVGEVVVLVPVV